MMLAPHSARSTLPLLACVAIAACTGVVSAPGDGERGQPTPGGPAIASDSEDLTAVSGLRRLTADEYRNTVLSLLDDPAAEGELLLPSDARLPFDNDYTSQEPSKALVEGANLLASDLVQRLLSDPARRDAVVGCEPQGPTDATCLASFISRFGRLAFRRTLSPAEQSRYAAAIEYSTSAGDFYEGVSVVLQAMLQDPNFLYRVERGTPVAGEPGLFRLNGNEVATRMSYLIWGTTPDSWLLDLAENGGLSSGEQLRSTALEMLDHPRALRRVQRFHAMWLGYEEASTSGEIGSAMRAETEALVSRVIFQEGKPWSALFTAAESFVTPALAEHYGLALPKGDAGWVNYGDSGRRGILSHGTYLAAGSAGADTSPTLRGIAVLERLLCDHVPPPPATAMIQPLPEKEPGKCKTDQLVAHAQPGCDSCHSRTDPIGFGLERFDLAGRVRDHEPDAPECVLDGQGEVPGEGQFNGPGELSLLMAASEVAALCRVTQLYRFTVGRSKLDTTDERYVTRSAHRLGKDATFEALVLDIVGAPEFSQRRAPEEEN